MASSNEEELLDGVAVVGLAGRFPGAASVDELWENLKAGRESIRMFTDEELAAAGVPRELIDDPSFVKARGLLDRPELFDAAFFGISPHEAELMDPQHRLFLETCWHALENAGYAPASVEGNVGVWGGMSTGMSNDTYLHANLGGPQGVAEQDVLPAMLGNENDYLCTRVSYKLNLRGPSVNVQSACSTSLVAIVQAFQSLMTYGCDLAVAGGVSVSYPQENGYLHQEGGIGSPDGHCRPFDADAQGTVFSNGVGAVVLKRLDEALEDGDTVLAVIRGAASNNDGASKVSFAAPSVSGQAEVIATAQAVADVDAASVTYVETHGTGTPIGDPIEVEGLTRAFRRSTDETGFCALGSIKSNFGHLDSAAGVAGFIKAVLCLRDRTLVPTVHFQTPSPRIDWDASPFFVNAETRPWDTDRLPRRAGVSAFGIGGTNAHVVLEEAPAADDAAPVGTGAWLLPVSARSGEALREALSKLARHIDGTPSLRLGDVAHTLQAGREAFSHRAAVVAGDLVEASGILTSADRTRLVTGEVVDAIDGHVFLFPGGGAQYVGMGRDLYEAMPDFRSDVDRGIALLEEREGVDLRPVWFADANDEAAEDAFQRPSVQLPAIFILEMALAQQLMRWGIEPSALIGHSLGENTAACLSGVLSYSDALGLVALRGRLFDTAASGGMLSVTASQAALRPFIGDELDLAAVNGPEQCTVSGPREPLDALAAALEEAGIDAQMVPIDIAAHSSLVEPLLEPFEAYLRSVTLSPPTIPFLSNRSGTWITDDEATDPAYWAAHLRSTVRFADNVRTALEEGRRFFLEVGPGRILSSLVKLSDPGVGGRVAAGMRHPRDETPDTHALLSAVGRLWVAGGEVSWNRIRGGAPVRRVPLPGYPFQREPFLIEPDRHRPAGAGTAGSQPARPGSRSASSATEPPPSSPSEALHRVLDLQARTNAAIQDLLRMEGGQPALASAASAQPDLAAAPTVPGVDGATGKAAPGQARDLPAADDATAGEPVPEHAAVEPSPAGRVQSSAPEEHLAEPRAASSSSPSLEPSTTTSVSPRHESSAASPSGPPLAPSTTPSSSPRLERPDLTRQLAFWTDHLEPPLPVLDLMTDSPRTPDGVARRAEVSQPLNADLADGLREFAEREGTSPRVVALAAHAAVLHLATGEGEFVVGVTGASSPANVLPIRARIDAAWTFRELVRRVHALDQEADLNGDATVDALLEALGPWDDTARAPLFQNQFVWAASKGPPHGSSGAKEVLPPDLIVTVDLADPEMDGHGDEADGRVRLDFAAGLFDERSMDDLLGHFTALLSAGIETPTTTIHALPGSAPGVMDRIAAWNDTDAPLPEVPGLAHWLTEQWPESASRTAIVAGTVRLTYDELDERSNRLANHLMEAGARPGALVGLCLERTADLLLAVVAVWKTGAGYVPLDPTYPSARLGLMADRAELRLVISETSLQERVESYEGEWILLDRDREAITARPATRPVVEADLADPAYVLFTSGSTGEPKGVRVPGRCVVNFLQSMAHRPGFGESDTLLAVTTLSFDISVLEYALPLRTGGTVVFASDADAMDGAALSRLMEANGVTVLQATPSTWRLLLAAGWRGRDNLRALCGGEAFPRDLLRQLIPLVAEVWNMYGPTETTIWSACARLTDTEAPIVIGAPIENTRCYVLDEDGRPVGPGVPGELHIGGKGVADGYVGRPEETARRFVTDPFVLGGGRMYRTGDAVRWRRDGTLEHLHRIDQQVKLRGFRIELGEVEAALAARPGIESAVVILTEIDGSPELVGYVTGDASQWSERSLRDGLVERLPGYMVPRTIVRLDELPLTENGKVDRKALPDPRGDSGWTAGDDLEGPETEGEVYLHALWQEVLEMSGVSVHDNFFDLGGHSLLAVRTIVRIREERGVEVPLRALIAGTLRTIAGEYLTGEPAPVPSGEPEAQGTVGRVLGSVREWISR